MRLPIIRALNRFFLHFGLSPAKFAQVVRMDDLEIKFTGWQELFFANDSPRPVNRANRDVYANR